MKRVGTQSDVFGTRTRLIIFHNSGLKASKALLVPDEEITYDLLLLNQVKAVNFVAAGVGPSALKTRGVDTASKLRDFGFDSLHLVNSYWCNEALLTFGREDLINTFLVAPEDAVALAGSPAMQMLKITTSELLERCIGFPAEAFAVMQQLPRGCSLKGVKADMLLDCGLHLSALSKCGYTIEIIIQDTNASAEHLQKLGFHLG